MLSLMIRLAMRRYLSNKLFSSIIVAGLAIGMAATFVIALHVRDEFSYGRQYPNAESISRLTLTVSSGDETLIIGRSAPPMGPAYTEQHAEILEFMRMQETDNSWTLQYQGHSWLVDNIAIVDSNYFSFFGYSLQRGDIATALNRPNTIVMHESVVPTYFGDEDPIGKTVTLINSEYEVTGVMSDPPFPEDYMRDILVSYSTVPAATTPDPYWFSITDFTYLRLAEGTDAVSFGQRLDSLYQDVYGAGLANAGYAFHWSLVPMLDMHFQDPALDHQGPSGNLNNVYLFSAIGFVILFLACINFINLTTARAASRAKEIGIGKVLGATRNRLILQSLFESILTALLALMIATGLIYLAQATFADIANNIFFTERSFTLHDLGAGVAAAVLIGLLAGVYPAFIMTSFKPILVLKGKVRSGMQGVGFRRVLVTAQFMITFGLLASTFIVQQQMNLIHEKSLHSEDEQVVIVPVTDGNVHGLLNAIKQDFAACPGVMHVSATRHVTGVGAEVHNIYSDHSAENQYLSTWLMFTDHEYLRTMGLNVVDGRDFTTEPENQEHLVILNETAAEQLGISGTMDEHVYIDPSDDGSNRIPYTVVGIVSDFHYLSLREDMKPTGIVYLNDPESQYYLNLRIRVSALDETLAQMQTIWENHTSVVPFDYTFQDEVFEQHYSRETSTQSLFKAFSSIAIFLTFMGLFGLISFVAEVRTREIGIRKVLGASLESIVVLLSKEFFLWLGIASVVAVPLVWYAMRIWLNDFSYHVNINPLPFIVALVVSIVIIGITVGSQALRAGMQNPAESIRHE